MHPGIVHALDITRQAAVSVEVLPMFSDQAIRYATLLLCLFNSGVTVFLWIVGKTLVSKAEFTALDKRMMQMEGVCEHCPARGGFSNLHIEVEQLAGSLKELNARIDGLRELLDRAERGHRLLLEQLLQRERE